MNSARTEAMNVHGQPIGNPVPGWMPPEFPPRQAMEGTYCRLEPLDVESHATALHEAFARDADGRNWTYLPYGPFSSFDEFRQWLISMASKDDPLFYAVNLKPGGKPVGVVSYLQIAPGNGSIEVGHIHFSKVIQRTPAATESMFLMMKKAFDLGYRRYEWKCDALNAPSCSAAQRLGFSFEGIFRQATIYKGRNRDSAWFAVMDSDWPALKEAFSRWLDPSNFDDDGRQRLSLRELTRPSLRGTGFQERQR